MAKRQKTQGGKGTGKPDPAKDRTKHEAKRGAKKTSLPALSSELPTDNDLINYQQYLKAESDRGAAIMAAALVERALEDVVRAYLAAPEDGSANTWFQGINAPFGTFSAKIAIGRALGIYGEHMERRLTIVKNVRNAFAHRILPLDFSHPSLIDECLPLSPHPEEHKGWSRRAIFGAACLALAQVLGNHATEHGASELEVRFP